MTGPSTAETARWLRDQQSMRATQCSIRWPAGTGLAQAYDVQDALLALHEGGAQPVAGYKIGLTTPRMQAMCGIDHPVAGAVLARNVHHSPARVRRGDFVRLGVECELAVQIGHPLPLGGRIGIDDVLGSIARIAAAFELIEDRNADYRSLDVLTLVAENSWNGGIVLGPAVAAEKPVDWDGELQIDGKFFDRGNTRDVLGHPFSAIAWLAGHLRARGKQLEAGQWVMTGSIVPTRFANPGEHYRFTVGALPPAELIILT